MKNVTAYARKLKSLLADLRRRYPLDAALDPSLAPLDYLVLGVMRNNTSAGQALRAAKTLREEFVDFNEMRVAPAKDIADVVGGDMPLSRQKAEMLTIALNRLFDQGKAFNLEYLAGFGKKELQTHLRETLLLDAYAEAFLTLHVFGGPTMPLDERMMAALKAGDFVHPDADAKDVRALLEKLVPARAAKGGPQQDMREAYEALCRWTADGAPGATSGAKGKASAGGKPATARKPRARASRAGDEGGQADTAPAEAAS